MTGKKVCKTLPDHLIERIVALLPFPSIFQARVLNRSWNARFSPILTDGAEKNRVAMSFQKLVGESCRNWKTLCPVLISPYGDFVAYNKETANWQKMPSLSFLPEELFDRCRVVQMEGVLLYASPATCESLSGLFYVVNVLTRTYKLLPPPPTIFCQLYSSKMVVTDTFSDTYKVILFCRRTLYVSDVFLLQIYDSKSESWSTKITADAANGRFGSMTNAVYLKGCLHALTCCYPPTLCTFNIGNGTMEERNLNASRWNASVAESDYCQLVLCNDNLYVVTGGDDISKYERVLKIDFESWSLISMSDIRSSRHALPGASLFVNPFGYDCHIHFGSKDEFGREIFFAYNVEADFWSCAFAPPPASFQGCYSSIASFQPSLSPFLAV